MKTILKRKVTNETMTRNVAAKIWKDHLAETQNFTLFVEGGLGAGKTFFIRSLLEIAGIEGQVVSPTYTYVQEYEANQKQFAHFDLYRLKNTNDFLAKGFGDIADDKTINKLLEWPERLENNTSIFSGQQFTLIINHGIGASMREIKLLQKEA